MSLIRRYYSVPAKRGGRVRLTDEHRASAGREGTITGTQRGALHLRVRLDGDTRTGIYHPTWALEYLNALSD